MVGNCGRSNRWDPVVTSVRVAALVMQHVAIGLGPIRSSGLHGSIGPAWL
jgi:hypothetical protein